MKIRCLDHLVLTVKDIAKTCEFYEKVLGFKIITFNETRKAMIFGSQKINLHQLGHEFNPKANSPTPGSADLCFIAETSLEDVTQHMSRLGVNLCEGPVIRTGAVSRLRSVYLRDPDGNLIEISNELRENC